MIANLSNIQRIYSEIPNEWEVDGEHIYNYNLLDTQTHFEHGWREVTLPSFDVETEKLSEEYVLVNDVVTKTIIALTQQDLEAIEEAKIPRVLTSSQIRQALVLMGKNPEDVVTAINQIPNAQTKAILLIRFEYEIEFVRTNADIQAIAGAIGVNLIELYKLGATL